MPSSESLSSLSDRGTMGAGITYVDGPRLARSLIAAADWVAAGREEINRINVFPVPDGDTGTNFSLTLRAVADALKALGDSSLPATATTMAQAAVLGAQRELRNDAGSLSPGVHRCLGRPERGHRPRCCDGNSEGRGSPL